MPDVNRDISISQSTDRPSIEKLSNFKNKNSLFGSCPSSPDKLRFYKNNNALYIDTESNDNYAFPVDTEDNDESIRLHDTEADEAKKLLSIKKALEDARQENTMIQKKIKELSDECDDANMDFNSFGKITKIPLANFNKHRSYSQS